MSNLFEQFIVWLWNRHISRRNRTAWAGALVLGLLLADGQASRHPVQIGERKRTEHIALLGKTGAGKSSLLRFMARQDIEQGRGFCFFDLHGDATPALLALIADQQNKTGEDFTQRVIVIEPGDPEFSVGLNVLEQRNTQHSFQQIAEFAALLRRRWHLDSFGARTEELLRNSLQALSAANWTLLELSRFLIDGSFRSACVSRSTNAEVKEYFGARYDRASESMQAVYRDAILNKVSAFTADPRFGHILGQRQSTFSLAEAIEQGFWILLNLDKGRLGEEASTLGSLFLTKLKNALFARRSRNLFSLYCDEIQNLVTIDSGLDSLLSEARKFGISICTANQFLDQYPVQMRSAILAIGTHIFFQLSSVDADRIASALGGGRSLAEILKNLPQRHMVVKIGASRPVRAVVPKIETARINFTDLYNGCRERWARRRSDVESDIRSRAMVADRVEQGGLDEWS